jgi:hypothetical protein
MRPNANDERVIGYDVPPKTPENVLGARPLRRSKRFEPTSERVSQTHLAGELARLDFRYPNLSFCT